MSIQIKTKVNALKHKDNIGIEMRKENRNKTKINTKKNMRR